MWDDKTKSVFICKNCLNYCDTNDCYNCDTPSTGVLTTIEINNEKDIKTINETLKTLNRGSFDVMLSHDGDGPAVIDIVEMNFEQIQNVIEKIAFIDNKITAVWDNDEFRECIGLALLSPYKYNSEEIRGLFIITDY